MVKQKQIKNKCVEGDSNHWASTGIQRHRLRALFERDDCGNTTGAGGLNRFKTGSKVGSFVRARYAQEREDKLLLIFQCGWYRGII